MEKLTIHHIAPYTLSKLKFKIDKRSQEEFEMIEVGQNYVTLHHEEYGTKRYFLSTNIYSPVLYPISCLTKTIQHEGTEFCPIVELAKIAFPDRDWRLNGDHAVLDEKISMLTFYYHLGGLYTNILVVENQYELFQKLAEWHIDFLGLIEKGLAIDKNTLK